MPNTIQQNPYYDHLAQFLSQQVLEHLNNCSDGFSIKETSEGFILRIPKSFFNKQANEQQAVDE